MYFVYKYDLLKYKIKNNSNAPQNSSTSLHLAPNYSWK